MLCAVLLPVCLQEKAISALSQLQKVLESVRFCILDFMGSSSNLPILQDLEKESDTPLQQVSIEEILEEQRVEQQTRLEAEKLKVQALKDRGLSIPRADTLDEY